MSLINDALKRATKAQEASSPVSEPAAQMQPVEQRRPVGLPVYFMPVLLFIVSGACFFLIKGWDARRQAGFYPQPITIQARELEPVQSEQTAVTEKEYPIPADRNFSVNDDSPSPARHSTAAAGSSAHVDAPQAAPSAFKLQGIFYKATSPSAVINSKTVYVGDTIANARVKAIGRQSVTLLQDGETKVLTLQ
jgi:hypothetical protein